MRLVHITDPHLTRPPGLSAIHGRSHWGKRYLGYASWYKGRRLTMRRPWLDELVREVRKLQADQILLTGDLTQIGLPEEIAEAAQWLRDLGSPEQVTLVPGNHDVYSADSWPEVAELWGAYLHLDDTRYPIARQFDDVQVLGLCSGTPTRVLSACGFLGGEQLEHIKAVGCRNTDRLPFVILHHPPLPGLISYRKRLRDAPALSGILEGHPAVILHGHHHRNLQHRAGDLHVYCTGSAASERASFRVFDVHREGRQFQVDARLIQRSPGGFETTGCDTFEITLPG